MKQYYLTILNQYQYYLVCMDYLSILNYLDVVESEPVIQHNQGNLVIDQLLVSGNSKNRFISCDFSHGEILLDTAQNIIVDESFKQLSADIEVYPMSSTKFA